MNMCLPSILKLRVLNFCPTSLSLTLVFFFNCKHFIQVSVKEYLWKCMHAKIVPFKYIKVCKELFALMSFGSIVTFAIKY